MAGKSAPGRYDQRAEASDNAHVAQAGRDQNFYSNLSLRLAAIILSILVPFGWVVWSLVAEMAPDAPSQQASEFVQDGRGRATAPAPDDYECGDGYFCIYSGWDGTGEQCQWFGGTKGNTADDCAFIQRGQNVLSVNNRSNYRVQYYTGTNYNPDTRVGSTLPFTRGNLQGNYQTRSMERQ